MKISRLLLVAALSAGLAAHAQPGDKKLLTVNLFGENLSLQPNSAFQKLSQALKGQGGASGFDIQPVAAPLSSMAFDGVVGGRVQAMWAQSAFFSSRNYALTLFSSPPFVSSERYVKWRALPETVRLADAVYAKMGLKAVPCSIIDANMDFVLRRVPDGDYAYRGARVVMTGPLQEAYAASGIMPLAIPIGEVPRAMQAGTVDGAYAYSPHESIELKLYESTKALVHPSSVRSFFAIDLIFNLKAWTELSAPDKAGIESVCRKMITETLASSRKLAAEAVEKYRKAGVPVMQLPDTETQAIRAKWEEMAARRSAFEPDFSELYKSLYEK